MSGLENDVLVAKNVNFDFTSNPPHNGIVTANGQLLIGSTANPNNQIVANTLTPGTGITITNGPGSITVASTASLTDLHTARFIVASSTAGTGANFTTIASAIAAAQGTGINSTIFLQPGTYTENFTLPPGINLCAYTCDALTPNVTIVGTITMTAAGSCSITGIRLQTNSAPLLAVTGSAASIINIKNCYLNCTNNTGISYTSSSVSSSINCYDCIVDHTATGITTITATGAGNVYFRYTTFNNSGQTTTPSTTSACMIFLDYCQSLIPFSSTSTGTIGGSAIFINTAGTNTTSITTAGTSASSFSGCAFASGSASAISIGSGTTVSLFSSNVSSSNTNAITGAGTLIYTPINFNGSSSTVNTSTQTPNQIGPKIYTNGGISFDNGTNTLDNYVVGTFTPTMVGQSVAGTTTYSTQSGAYTRIGNVVYVTAVIVGSTATGTGNINYGGLPFTIKNQSINSFGNVQFASGRTFPVSTTSVNLQGTTNSTTALPNAYGSAVGVLAVQMQNIPFNDQYTLVYQI